MPPAVAPGLEVRQAAASVRLQRRRHLDDRQAGQRAPYHHLARKLHARRFEPELPDGSGPEGAQPAVEIVHPNAEE